jgi:hypothetical protein
MFDNALKVFVIPDEFESTCRSDTFDGVEVIAAKEDAEVDEL